jgi:hypothetical protein
MHHEKSKKLVKSKSPKKVEQAGSTVEINQMKFLIYHILTKEHLFKSFIFNLQYIHTCGKTSFYFIIPPLNFHILTFTIFHTFQ